MKWHLYKKDDPNTWPQIDCPMVVYYPYKQYYDSADCIILCCWDNDRDCFYTATESWDKRELYYAYIGYVPSGYKTCYPVVCTCKDCPEGHDDNGYCMDYDNDYACGYKKEVPEYGIEEKAIWKEFE